MTFITEKIRGAVTTAAVAERPLMDLNWTWIATAAICAFFVGAREYEQMFGWKAGMDSYSGEFQTYWMPVLYIFATLELIAFLGLVFYLFRTRDLDVAKVEPREELRGFSTCSGGFCFTVSLFIGAPTTSANKRQPGIRRLSAISPSRR